MNATEHENDCKTAFPMAGLLALFVLFDFVVSAAAASAEAGVFSIFSVGAVLGQIGVLAAWAVLGPQPFAVRGPRALAALAFLYCTCVAGLVIAGMPGALLETARGIVLLPLLFLCAQLPLWLMRVLVGCRIVVQGAEESLVVAQWKQFSIKQMLSATTVVALCLGLASLGFGNENIPASAMRPTMWRSIVGPCAILSVAIGVSTLPCLYAGLAMRNVAASSLAVGVYTLATPVLMVFLATAVLSPMSSGEIWWGLVYAILFNGGLTGVLFGCFRLARARGYVLLWPRRKSRRATVGRDSAGESGSP